MSPKPSSRGSRPSSRRKAPHLADLSPKNATGVLGGKKKKKPNYDDLIRDNQVSFDETGGLNNM